jgi:hypothetical protein
MCGDISVTGFIGPVIRRAFVGPALHLTVWLIKTRLQSKSAFVDFFERMVVKQVEVNLTMPLKLQALSKQTAQTQIISKPA